MKFIHLSDLHILARNDVSRLPDAAATLRNGAGLPSAKSPLGSDDGGATGAELAGRDEDAVE